MSRQEGYITQQELSETLKKKIDDSSTNSTLTKQQIGDLTSLKTTNKNTLVTAINEVKDSISTVVNNTLGSAELTTNDKTIKGAINEVKNSISTVVNNTLGSATLNTSDKTVKGAINEVKNNINTVNNTLGTATLNTNDKTIKGAINEAFRFANDGKFTITSVIGSPTTSNNTFNEIKNNIQNCKNTLASGLNNKGVGATSNETLLSLAGKVNNISVATMGGTRLEILSGTDFLNYTENGPTQAYIDMGNIPFTKLYYVYFNGSINFYTSSSSSPTNRTITEAYFMTDLSGRCMRYYCRNNNSTVQNITEFNHSMPIPNGGGNFRININPYYFENFKLQKVRYRRLDWTLIGSR